MTGAARLAVVAVLAAIAVLVARRDRVAAHRVAPVGAERTGARDRQTAAGVIAVSVGAAVRRSCGRPPDPRADRRVGRLVLVVAATSVVDPALGLAVGVVTWLVPWWRRRIAVARRGRALDRAVPDLVDLVGLGVTAGLPVRGALRAAVAHLDGPLGEAVAEVLAEADRGRPLADALAAARLGVAAQPLVDALVAGERYGAPMAAPLARVADEARRVERRRVDTAARRLPVTLLFPLVLCTLPAFALVTVVPVLVTTLSALDG